MKERERERELIGFIQYRRILTHLCQDANSPQSFTPLPSPHSAPRATPRSAATAGAPRCVPASSAAKTAARQAASSGAPHLQVKMAIWWQLGKLQQNINKSKTHNATWAKARLAVFECIYNRYILKKKYIYIYMSKFNKLRLYSEVGSEQERQHWSDLSGAKQRLWPKSFPSGRLCMLHLEQCLADRRLQPQYDSCWNCWPTMLDKISDLRFEGEQKLYYMDYISF